MTLSTISSHFWKLKIANMYHIFRMIFEICTEILKKTLILDDLPSAKVKCLWYT